MENGGKPGALAGKKIVVGVSGSIAAYKACELCSRLAKAGASVRVAMTAGAARFVQPLTFETLTQHPVYTGVFGDTKSYEMEHISWAKWADAVLIAPATADLLARMAAGMADDAVLSLVLSCSGPVIVAPAMNTQMLNHPATVENLARLRARGVQVIEPDSGMLACGDTGPGKLADPAHIVEVLPALMAHGSGVASPQPSLAVSSELVDSELPADDSLTGKTVLVTSGPTHEYLDPVRFLTNPSSGKMGSALAREAGRRGARVLFITGPVGPAGLPGGGAEIHKVTTAEQMHDAVMRLAPGADILVFAAAVSDFRVESAPAQKIKRTGNSLTLPLIENPDISQAVGATKRAGQITVGFAAETDNLEQNALGKMDKKKLDMIVANNVSNPRIGFERDVNAVTIYQRGRDPILVSERPKQEVAVEVFNAIAGLAAQASAESTAG